MSTPVRFSLIGCAVFVIAIVGAVVMVGPQQLLSSVFFSLSSDTEYAPGYSDEAFNEVEIGDLESDVIAALGKPISERGVEAYINWVFSSAPIPEYEAEGIAYGYLDFTEFRFSPDGELRSIHGQIFGGRTGGGLGSVEVTMGIGDGQNFLGIKNTEIDSLKKAGTTSAQIEATYGKPNGVFESKVIRWLVYSRSPGSKNYQRCWIGLDADGNVVKIKNERYWD